MPKNLQLRKKVPIFAASNIKLDYPVSFREEQDFIDTTPLQKSQVVGSFAIYSISLKRK